VEFRFGNPKESEKGHAKEQVSIASQPMSWENTAAADEVEYVVVGSGAGGGTVASRLAEAGHSVVVLEAGGDPRKLAGGDALKPEVNRLPSDYDVPAFHAFASENEALRWDFFVRHTSNDELQKLDPNYREDYNGKKVDGVLYPRAGTLGGCTAHNAMIFIAPDDETWEGIANITQDQTWEAAKMRRYFERVENCRYLPWRRYLAKVGINPTRHGWKGWLQTEKAMPMATLNDRALRDVVVDGAFESYFYEGKKQEQLRWLFEGLLDPNDWRLIRQNAEGVKFTPLTTRNHARVGTRERLLETRRRHPNLCVELNALATRVLLDKNQRAFGVEYLRGERLYRASPRPNPTAGPPRMIRASKEVILAGGAFNSPQLLMLSGIGPRDLLENLGIPVRVELPGVGKNLQDRYEVGVNYRMKFPAWKIFNEAKFDFSDPQFRQWLTCRSGVYATNGSVISVFKKSTHSGAAPDLFCMALLANFQGYYPGYSTKIASDLNYLTWAILKGHTGNRAGAVTLCSSDARDMPRINFHSFAQGAEADIEAMVEAVHFVRRLAAPLREQGFIEAEEQPGEGLSDKQLQDFIRCRAWGHHASSTCPIGAKNDIMAVLDSNFRVRGTTGLRVVDASVFPQIPGLFIVCAIYMIAEKAADAILGGE
jgi:choline dehydrogenase-like flavoprotein